MAYATSTVVREGSHRVLIMRRAKKAAKKFLRKLLKGLTYGPIAQHFRPRRHLLSASAYRQEMGERFESWAEMTGTEWAA